MTLADIENIDKEFLLADEVAQVLGINPQQLRSQAQADPNKLGFPVIVTGTRVRIPKYGFIHFCKYGRNLTILDNDRSNNCGTNCYMPTTTDAGSGAYVWAG